MTDAADYSRELTPDEKVLRLKAFVAIYDRAMLEKHSLAWFDGVASQVEALPSEASADEVDRLFHEVMEAYRPLSMAHLSDAVDRLDTWKVDQGPSGEIVARWTYWGLTDFMGLHKTRAEAAMEREGIDPFTNEPLPNGWLELDIPEVEEAWFRERGWEDRFAALQESRARQKAFEREETRRLNETAASKT